MNFVKQIALLVLLAGTGLSLTACQPSSTSAPPVAKLSSIAIAPSPVSLEVGGMQSLIVTGSYADGTTYDLSFNSTFASSASGVARVSATGVVTGVAPGTATITATHTPSGKTANVTVTVAPLRVISISVTPKPLALTTGSTAALTVTGTFNNATTGSVTADSTFESDNPDVAAVVAATGVITAKSAGTAVITATHTASGKTDTVGVTVSEGLTALINGVWSSNYSQVDGSNWTSTEGGAAGRYIDTGVPTQDWWNGVAPGDATPSFYFGYGINSGAKPWGFGAFVKAPGNGTADVSPYTNVQIAVWGNDQLMNSHPTLAVILKGPTVNACATELKASIAVSAPGVQTYTLALSAFTLQTACGLGSAAAALAAGVAEIHIQVLGANVQYVAGDDGSGNFPNGLNVGPISFNSDGGGGAASGNTGTCTSAPCIDFSSPNVAFEAFEGLVSAAVVDDPVDPTNKVARLVKGPAGQPWAGATVYTVAADKTVDAIGFDTSKIITLRVRAPAVGTKIRIKAEDGTNGAVSMEVDALTTTANEWETLTFDFTTPAAGAYDPAKTYNKISIFPAFLTAVGAETPFYFDELNYAAASGGGGGGGMVNGVYASNYSQVDPTNWTSTEGGAAGTYIDTGVATAYWWNGFASADATPSFYFGYGINSGAKPWGFGAFVKAPGNGTAVVSGYTNFRISVWGNDELMNTHPTLTLIMKGPDVGGCAPEIQGSIAVSAPGAQTYTVPLNTLTLKTACAFSSVAEALAAGISEIHVQVLGANVQYVTGNDGSGNYPNGLNVGPMSFN